MEKVFSKILVDIELVTDNEIKQEINGEINGVFTVETTVETTVGKLLSLIKQNPQITQQELIRKLGLSRRGVEWNIKKMKENGIIKRIGAARGEGGQWEVIQ